MAGRDWGSHLAWMLALCPGASLTFTRQKACQKLEVTLRKMLYSLGDFTVVGLGGGGGGGGWQLELIRGDSKEKTIQSN